MASVALPSSKPELPLELEFRIFETCYFMYPKALPTLLLVCRDVFERLNTIRYYSVKLCFDEDVERIETWMHTQSQQSIHKNIKGLLIDLPQSRLFHKHVSVALSCTGVESLGIWIHNVGDDVDSQNVLPEEFIGLLLKNLSNVKHLSLSSDWNLFEMINSGSSKGIEMEKIVFRESLVSIDWGSEPRLPLETFPNVSYTMMQPRWPLQDDDMRRMEEWRSRPSSKGLILIVDEADWNASELALPLAEGHILCNKNVVLVKNPLVWVTEWDSYVFGDEKDVFSIGKRLVGLSRLEDRAAEAQAVEVSREVFYYH
ncbi:hypothetical protein DL96DRAFT_1827440 [Flagelloscypha sp. PMI_526]|nr:hypothetical protein DL96DRAFT_1827440 [Flagelloscypha sp. PMI_526]